MRVTWVRCLRSWSLVAGMSGVWLLLLATFTPHITKAPDSLQQVLREVDSSVGQRDGSSSLKTHMFLVVGERWKEVGAGWQVCLAAQTSVEHLFWVAHQAQTWTGPLSVAVFAPDYDYSVAAAMIAFLQQCVPGVRHRAVFHLTYPTTLLPLLDDKTRQLTAAYTCDSNPEEVNKQLLRQLRPSDLATVLRNMSYPQNLLRNVARSGCGSSYTFLPDVDMILVTGMASKLNQFLAKNDAKNCTKCAYIIPTYEVHDNITNNPAGKGELLQLLKKKLAQRFHTKVFGPNQGNSDLSLWEKVGSGLELEVAYSIREWRSFWEPVYVSLAADTPLYDQRFIGYGFTRSSQVLEMAKRGFSWHVLNNAFLCHRGFQTLYKDPIRWSQINRNAVLYRTFKKEMDVRYPQTRKENGKQRGKGSGGHQDKGKQDKEQKGKENMEYQEKGRQDKGEEQQDKENRGQENGGHEDKRKH